MIAPVESPLSTSGVPFATAEELNRYLVQAFRIGNRARLRFARLLAALADSRLYLQLGHPSIAQYAERRFGLPRSETFELRRVAQLVDELPACREAFESGKLSWSALKLITRVANHATESEWLAFAADHSYVELRAEVQDAQRKNRANPRTDRFGLPDLSVKITVSFSREEYERFQRALEKVGGEIAPALNDQPAETKDVLLYLAERFLRTDPEGTPEGRTPRDDSPYTIVYHRCEDCRRSRLLTADGPVEVSPERVDGLTGDATEVHCDSDDAANDCEHDGDREHDGGAEIDRPNPAALARRVRLRAGGVCQNPGCRCRDELHAHHIQFRSHGGRTVLDNEVALCRTCHALVHAGLLEISGDPFTKLSFRPRSAMLDEDANADGAALSEIPVPRVESGIPDSPGDRIPSAAAKELNELAGALVQLGFSRTDARARIERAYAELQENGESMDEGRLVTYALRAS